MRGPLPLGVVRAVATRPDLWSTAIRVAWGARHRRWWRRPPFLPVPDASWMAWRIQTAYGDDRAPDVDGAIDWLEWRRDFRALTS